MSKMLLFKCFVMPLTFLSRSFIYLVVGLAFISKVYYPRMLRLKLYNQSGSRVLSRQSSYCVYETPYSHCLG